MLLIYSNLPTRKQVELSAGILWASKITRNNYVVDASMISYSRAAYASHATKAWMADEASK